MLSLFVFSLYFDHFPTDRLQMGEVVSTIPTSNGPKRLAENKMLMLRQLAKRWRKGFSFHFFYSPCFFSWTPLQLRCKLCF
ncbi:hypothetical protein ES332_D03G132200v1 [Gossypium tomentosum]|uniref:Uncharacterized protein n=1 Tax=Gossypium tomentosum TaxID=34277 RepID=A0A5D2LMG6_GOSTO|nr:hypothetical protein ES332_D03G132200v1 [Gossypium tomentosum]TYH80436.1 hypothetical protein ES332_D03G132200v1 [Gossypium tomentosum]TYH80438.1 hypothetical protein ES332_D03G132200v1 [Gossypium tomentosum]